MLEIKLIGGDRTGKTSHALSLAENWLHGGKQVLYVAPTIDMAIHAVQNDGSELARFDNFTFIGSGQFAKAVRGRNWDLIILDELNGFKPSSEGSYVSLAKQRLRITDISAIAYTLPEDVRVWVSTSKWYMPWTWGTGYWSF